MNTSPQKDAAVETTTEEASLLDQVIGVTKQTDPDRTTELLRTLTDEAMQGTVTFNRNLTITLTKAIEAIDGKISRQLAAIMQDEKFSKLEGSWRGLHFLLKNSNTSSNLKVRVLNASKAELSKDLLKAMEFDQSRLFKSIYENEFGTPGGEPIGAIIGDYEFENTFEDVELLENLSSVSAAAFAPFISAASPKLFGFEDYTELAKPRDLSKIFDSSEYAKWRAFRQSDDSRFVTLTMPRVLARVPYGPQTRTIEAFAYDEAAAYEG
ncbi:MAG: type VI secretion system contractile sheath large subunit, partial [Pseudomonadota bacterium]